MCNRCLNMHKRGHCQAMTQAAAMSDNPAPRFEGLLNLAYGSMSAPDMDKMVVEVLA